MQSEDGLFHQLLQPSDRAPTRWFYLLHGILGQGGNLRTVARRWLAHHPDAGAVLIDLRNHGRSLHLAPPDDLDACAADIERLAQALGAPPTVVLGHSFGGKVAMKLAERAHQRGAPLASLWVLDSTVGTKRIEDVESHPGSTKAIVEMLEALPSSFSSREWFATTLEDQGLRPSLVAWLAMSVIKVDSGYRFGPELPRIRAMLQSYFATDAWPVIETPMAARVQVVVAGQSTTFSTDDRDRLRAAAAQHPTRVSMHLFEDSSHWVHVDGADALDALLAADPACRGN